MPELPFVTVKCGNTDWHTYNVLILFLRRDGKANGTGAVCNGGDGGESANAGANAGADANGADANDARARHILSDWGPVLLAGVHVTNLLGVSVLVLATSPVFNVYYFRMYMAVVLTGAAHGLVLLPVLLAVFGP